MVPPAPPCFPAGSPCGMVLDRHGPKDTTLSAVCGHLRSAVAVVVPEARYSVLVCAMQHAATRAAGAGAGVGLGATAQCFAGRGASALGAAAVPRWARRNCCVGRRPRAAAWRCCRKCVAGVVRGATRCAAAARRPREPRAGRRKRLSASRQRGGYWTGPPEGAGERRVVEKDEAPGSGPTWRCSRFRLRTEIGFDLGTVFD